MALLHVNFRSQALQLAMGMDVIIPEKAQYPTPTERKEYPVLYLLHGLSDDQSAWHRKTRIEEYVNGKDLIVVMPTTHRAFYTNTVSGYKYFDFVSKELPAICASMFPISTKREDTFAAGLSMGGYGAFKLGVLCHDKFAAVASLSGAVDVAAIMDRNTSPEFFSVFGENTRGSENDIIAQLEKLIAEGASLPRFYQACGTEDFLYLSNTAFRDRFKDRIDLTYEEGPGVHNWDFWDEYIRHVLKWLPIK
ncbi:MAG: esterase family protein [Clostridiales bacterium]|nr:esterase family protein [Clostridiales bacterium]